MEGRAYTPKSWNPESHGKFASPSKEIMDKWYKERFKVLNHYEFEKMYDIYAGIEDKLFVGAIDTHLHIYPDYVPRSIDMIQYAIDASKAGMRAIIYKEHFFTNVHGAWAVQYIIDDLVSRGELDHAVKVFGSINLAFSHHPDQVELICRYPNLGAIFFYTFTGGPPAHHLGPELPLTDNNGKLLPEIKKILKIAAENKVGIMTGHKTPENVLALVRGCNEAGANCLITHSNLMVGTSENIKECIRLGAYFEGSAEMWLPNVYFPCQDPNSQLKFIEEIGPEHIILNTDFGQLLEMHPVEGFKIFVRAMLHYGFKEDDIKAMIQRNPARFLYLEE